MYNSTYGNKQYTGVHICMCTKGDEIGHNNWG